MMNMLDLVNDMRIMGYNEYYTKYKNQLPKDLLISEVVDEIMRTGGVQDIIDDRPFDGSDPARNEIAMAPTGKGTFEVFTCDRGGKFWEREFVDLRDALTCFVDQVLNHLGVQSPDSTVYKD